MNDKTQEVYDEIMKMYRGRWKLRGDQWWKKELMPMLGSLELQDIVLLLGMLDKVRELIEADEVHGPFKINPLATAFGFVENRISDDFFFEVRRMEPTRAREFINLLSRSGLIVVAEAYSIYRDQLPADLVGYMRFVTARMKELIA